MISKQFHILVLVMIILNKRHIEPSKRTVYLDVDDVVLWSAGTIVGMLNERYGLNKTRDDIKDWGFKSIKRDITTEEVLGMFNEDEFWERNKSNQKLIEALEKDEDDENGLYRSYNWRLVTKGDRVNLEKKFEKLFQIPFFSRHKNEIGYYRIEMHESKNSIRMLGRIQIDDYYFNLRDTDASLKILLKNDLDANYNSYYTYKDGIQNLYVCDNLEQVVDILMFAKDDEINEFISELENMDEDV